MAWTSQTIVADTFDGAGITSDFGSFAWRVWEGTTAGGLFGNLSGFGWGELDLTSIAIGVSGYFTVTVNAVAAPRTVAADYNNSIIIELGGSGQTLLLQHHRNAMPSDNDLVNVDCPPDYSELVTTKTPFVGGSEHTLQFLVDPTQTIVTLDGETILTAAVDHGVMTLDRVYLAAFGMRVKDFTVVDTRAIEIPDGPLPTQASAHIAAPSPLSPAKAVAFHDFTAQLGDTITHYVMDLLTPTGTYRVPISSWQATLQTGSSNYVQCVIPACSQWVDTLNAATEFVIWRRAVLPSGAAIEYEMARAPADTPAFDQSPSRHTCTLSGYSDAFAESLDPPAAYDRELTGLRTISSGSSLRVRCAVDWLLRPGHRAYVQGAPFVVRYINYYAPSGFDSYMDVGE